MRPRADSDGNYGRLQAVNFESGEVLWTYRQRTPLIPEVRLPSSLGPVVWVFELPER